MAFNSNHVTSSPKLVEKKRCCIKKERLALHSLGVLILLVIITIFTTGTVWLLKTEPEKTPVKPDPVDCGIPKNGVNTRVIDPGLATNYTSLYRYRCLDGYKASSIMVTSCMSSGRWSLSSPPVCKVVDCGLPLNGVYTILVNTGMTTTYLSTYTYICIHGYESKKMLVTQCEATGKWSLSPPVCSVVDCFRPPNGINTHPITSANSTVYNSVYTYVCQVGYQSDLSLTTECKASGRWSLSSPECRAIDCGRPEEGTNTNPVDISLNTVYPNTYQYTCMEGYIYDFNMITGCEVTGSWSLSPPTCTIVDCHLPPYGINTYHDDSIPSTEYGSVYTYTCLEGYESNSVLDTRCEASGHWSLSHPACTVVDCELPPRGINTEYIGTSISTLYPSSYIYICLEGYNTSSHLLVTTCEASGNWSLSPPTCSYIDCGIPPDGLNTQYIDDAINTTYQSVYIYTCLEGYKSDVTLITECNSPGRWSLSSPTCSVIECDLPAEGSNTMVVDATISTEYQSSYTYSCKEGYTSNSTLATECEATGNWSLSPPTCTDADVAP